SLRVLGLSLSFPTSNSGSVPSGLDESSAGRAFENVMAMKVVLSPPAGVSR
ncbi:unnamed protein product, partial [Ceratitis capitata]